MPISPAPPNVIGTYDGDVKENSNMIGQKRKNNGAAHATRILVQNSALLCI